MMSFLERYLVVKAPLPIPPRAKEWIVRWWPRITLVMLAAVLLLWPFLYALMRLREFGASFGGASEVASFRAIEVGLIVQLLLTATSLRGLFQRRLWGWNAIFCARIVGVTIGLLAVNGADRSAHALGETLVALYILFQLIQMYILLQVRSLYTA